jgi:hypothetical protein
VKSWAKNCAVLLVLLPWLVCAYPAGAAASPCTRVFGAVTARDLCVSRSRSASLARTAPFSEVDPTSEIRGDAGLSLTGIRVVRSAGTAVPPALAVAPTPRGPAVAFFYRYGRVPAPQRFSQPPSRRATFVEVDESLEAESRGISLLQAPAGPGPLKRTGVWTFSADLDRHHVTLLVESDGPKAVVSRIGWGLIRTLRASRVPPSLPVQVYVYAPRGNLHVGRAATFWVADDGRLVTAHVGIDFAFSLSGGWSRPRTITPDGTQSCGGDNAAGQPFLRRGLWRFAWGDCDELGLVVTPTRTGVHAITIYSYRVPFDARGVLDFAHEQLEPRGTYSWRGIVRA